ncbi:MAG: enoyl-CoA hydratase/isomerase, partial [Caulobacteraceae bacterium]
AIAKRLLWDGLTTSVADMARREDPLFAWAGRQPDAREGVTAFLEKREPQWRMKASTDLPRDLLGLDGSKR